MTPFAIAAAALDAFKESSWVDLKLFESCYTESLRRALWPGKRKFDFHKVAALPGYAEHRAPWQAVADSLHAERAAEIKALQASLEALAVAEPVPVAELFAADHIGDHRYSTQGYGAASYARGHAQELADKATHYGILAEVRREPNAYGTEGFAVYAGTTPTGWRQLSLMPDVPLRDWIAACLKRGTNPRVFNPFLPWGIEERLGIDGFGNLIEPREDYPLSSR